MSLEATARPAATILLLRDGADGIEVFMVVRHQAIDFASGALVFPGGRVEEADYAHCRPNPRSSAARTSRAKTRPCRSASRPSGRRSRNAASCSPGRTARTA